MIALTLLYSAFISEIYRAALEAIPRGQREAGLALGMRPLRVFVRIVLPQATKIAIPNIGSMFIGMVKDTSTFTVIGAARDRSASTQNLSSRTSSRSCSTRRRPAIYVIAAFVDRLRLPRDREVAHDAAEGRLARRCDGRRRRRDRGRHPARGGSLQWQLRRRRSQH